MYFYRRGKFVLSIVLILVLVFNLYLYSQNHNITGFFTTDGSFSDDIERNFETNSIFLWSPSNQIDDSYLGISGNASGSGNVKVSLIHGNDVFVILNEKLENEKIFFKEYSEFKNKIDLSRDKYLLRVEVDNVEVFLESIYYSNMQLGVNSFDKIELDSVYIPQNITIDYDGRYDLLKTDEGFDLMIKNTTVKGMKQSSKVFYDFVDDLNIKTEVFAMESVDISNATVVLESRGNVEVIKKCNDFHFDAEFCVSGWYDTNIPFNSSNDTITFVVDSFSAYAGGEISSIQDNYVIQGGSSEDFISLWNTSKISAGSSNSTTIALPLQSTGTYNFNVTWGDGNSDIITVWNQPEVNHTYALEGEYQINISGIINGFRFNNDGDRLKIIDIQQWGNLNVGNSNSYFYGCENLDASAIDALNLTGTTNLYRMFYDASSFNGNISNWDVSSVTDMGWMFNGATSFNQDISNWNTSSVTSMRDMFHGATSFNQDISNWNTFGVTTMQSMFDGASNFDQDLGNWNISSITEMTNMFRGITLSISNYDNILMGWEAQIVLNDTIFNGGNSQYCNGETARNNLINNSNWTITDGGKNCTGINGTKEYNINIEVDKTNYTLNELVTAIGLP